MGHLAAATFNNSAILKISAIFNFFFLAKSFWYILGLCPSNWLLQIEIKNYFTVARAAQRKVIFSPSHLEPIRHFDFPKKKIHEN
jgi:hypothetical protein